MLERELIANTLNVTYARWVYVQSSSIQSVVFFF